MTDSCLKEIPVEYLRRGKYQPRVDFDPDALNELAASIVRTGIIQPIFVRPIENNQYEIIAGERRWRAAQIAGLDSVPCLIKDISDEDAIAATTIENIQRQDLNPIEEAQAYQRMVNEFDYKHEEIASIIGKSRPKISNLIRLLTLDPRAQKVIIEERLSEGHAKVIAGQPIQEHITLAMKSVKNKWSVRQLEQYIKNDSEDSPIMKRQDPNIKRLEQTISDYLGTQVKLNADKPSGGGWLSIHYHDLEILAGILDKIGVEYDG